jgi:SAM-dependent methyltransferase
MKDWTAYIQKTTGNSPHQLLLDAIQKFHLPVGKALDFGCGAMNDTIFLKSLGYDVVALDSYPMKDPPPEYLCKTFEEYDYPADTFDLINAQFSLPFVRRSDFARVIEGLLSTLKPGGAIVGNFFGPNDSWAGKHTVVAVSNSDTLNYLDRMDILYLEEKEYDGPAAFEDKHWHLINFIARKPSRRVDGTQAHR